MPAPPPVDIPAIIPLTSASTSAPPPAPPLPSTAPSVLSSPPPPPLPITNELPAPTVSITNEIKSNNDDNDDDGGDNPLLAQIRNFSKTNKLKSATRPNPVDEVSLPTSNDQENIMETLKKRLAQRRGLIAGETSSSATDKPAAPPATSGSLVDAIAAKAKDIAEQQRKQNDSDNSDDGNNDDDWE